MTPLSDQYKNAFHVEGPTVDAVIATLQSQLTASKEREHILRDGLESIRDGSSLPVYCAVGAMKRADEVEP